MDDAWPGSIYAFLRCYGTYRKTIQLYRVIRNDCRGFNNLVLQMQPHVISFYGVTSRIRFMFLVFPASIPELKVRIRTATETIITDIRTVWNELDYRVFVCRITRGAHIESCRACNKNLECCSIK